MQLSRPPWRWLAKDMSRNREKILVVCPGRGCYNRSELGYIQRFHADKTALIEQLDDLRRENAQTTISQLDQSTHFDSSLHTRSDNASSLIYACSLADFLSIDQTRYEVIAVTGNSLGWYSALACSGAMQALAGMRLVNTMGRLMQHQAPGGQLVYPTLDDNWQPLPERQAQLESLLREINSNRDDLVYDSIYLGGFRVLAGSEAALAALAQLLPKTGSYPLRLPYHAAFHSPLINDIADQARGELPVSLFQAPALPLVDGCGQTWYPLSSEINDLWDYTLGHQLVISYDFTRAIQVSVREFAPDRIVLTGPGNSLGGATAQSLIAINWHGMRSKQDFIESQCHEPFILSMGIAAQRELLTK